MATDDTAPWDSPLAGTEVEHLAGVPPGEPWQTINWDGNPHCDFTATAAADTPEQLSAKP